MSFKFKAQLIKIKLEREHMRFFMENEIKELAKKPLAEIESEKVNRDDIDVCLKWLDLFHRINISLDGRFTMTLKIQIGVTTSLQTRFFARIIEKNGADGSADVITQQNWQIRGVMLDDLSAILKGLKEVGLSRLQSQMDNVRCPMGNYLVGIDADEIIETRPFTKVLTDYIVNNGKGNPSITNL